ncbi:MAG: hypothetical protein WB505_00955, partial [Pseudolabrys sp.]
RSLHADFFSAEASTGSFRKRFPVAAKIALVTAGSASPGSHSFCRTNDVGCSLRSFSWEFPSTGRHPTGERHNPSRRAYNSTVTPIVRVAN